MRGRIASFVIGPVPAWADLGLLRSVTVAPHPYLECYRCESPLWHGQTADDGAPVLICSLCRRVTDERRVP